MTLTSTHPLSSVAIEIEHILRTKLPSVAAQRWFFAAQEAFGGMSAVQMLKAGRVDEVRDAAKLVIATNATGKQ